MNMATVLYNIFYCVYCLRSLSLYDVGFALLIVVLLPLFLSSIFEKRKEHHNNLELNEISETIIESGPSRTAASSSTSECKICTESIPNSSLFSIHPCSHSFCVTCTSQYITSKLNENIAKINCPDENCEELLDPDECKGIIPSNLFDRWGIALCEFTLGTKKFYCPFQDCSFLLVSDDTGGTNIITSCECPECHRLFCAQCKVPWHAEMDCVAYQKTRRWKKKERQERRMLLKLAARNKWQKCPHCKAYVERIDGCKLIKCRCGYHFCYTCGAHMSTHNCEKCMILIS